MPKLYLPENRLKFSALEMQQDMAGPHLGSGFFIPDNVLSPGLFEISYYPK